MTIEEVVFGTFTQELERLRTWLKQHKVRQVAMESTGVYWMPVWNILESGPHPFTLTLVNPSTWARRKVRRRTGSMRGGLQSICSMVCCGEALFHRNRSGSCVN